MKSKTPLLFCLIIATFISLDLLFIYIAKTTYAGVVTENSYHKGLKSLGKKNLITNDFKVYINHLNNELEINLECKHVECRSIRSVEVKIGRPVTDKFDKNYQATIIKNNRFKVNMDSFTLKEGQWDIKMKINFENESKYFYKRLTLT